MPTRYLKLLVFIIAMLPVVTKSFAQDVEKIEEQKPFRITGTLAANAMFFDVQGRPPSREPFTWFFTGNPTLEIYGITLPFSFTVSEQQRDFRQPFNQFGVSPYYKWATLHLGYRNLVFSPFTLGGHTMAGVGTELKPGKLRFGFMYGRLFRAIQAVGDPVGTYIADPTFLRTGASIKVGYGTDENFVDLVLLKAKDDPNSIDYTSSETGITPAENLVVGIYSKQKFLKKFFFELEFAQSAYTRNTDLTEADTVKGGMLTRPFLSLMDAQNISTTHNTAFESSLGYEHDIFGLRIKYREVGPSYQSMGAYFFQNDIRNITVEPTVRLFKSMLQASGSFGHQTDNLDKRRANTTTRTIGSVNLTGRIKEIYTGNLTYSNYDIGQATGTVNIDTLIQISQTVQSYGMMHNVMLTGEQFTHNVMINYNYQVLNDRNPNTSEFSNYETDTWLASYYITFVPLRLSVTASYTLTNFELPTQRTGIAGPTIGVTRSFLKNALSINLMYSSMAYTVNDQPNRTINRIAMNSSYRAGQKHRINLRFYLNQTGQEAENVQTFREIKGDIGYAYTF